MASRRKPRPVPIDHGRLTDSFGELLSKTHYESRTARCARCGASFELTAAAQKSIHEQRGVPVSRGERAGLCRSCAIASSKRARASDQHDRMRRSVETARLAAAAKPEDGGLLLEYVVAKLRLIEQYWSPRVAATLLGELRRVVRLDPKLEKSARKWETALRRLIALRR